LNQEIDRDLYHAVSVLLLCAPQIPMLFMGQEWGANTPFCYFTDHDQELGMLVTKGRMDEFSRFRGFSDPESRKSIPDPQSEKTFEASRLQWSEIEQQPHAQTLSLYKELLGLRKQIVTASHNVTVQNPGTISIRYASHTVLVHLAPQQASLKFPDGRKHVLWSSGQISADAKTVRFTGPGAAILNTD
jgi:maltooligosyltrehalose trehalohydrolase